MKIWGLGLTLVTIQRQNTNNGNNQCSAKGNRENSDKKMLSNRAFLLEIPFQLLFGNVYHLSFLFLQQLRLIKFAYTSYLSFYKFLEEINAEFSRSLLQTQVKS